MNLNEGRAVALFAEQKFVTPSHVTAIVGAILAHRITLRTQAASQMTASEVIWDVLNTVIPPS